MVITVAILCSLYDLLDLIKLATFSGRSAFVMTRVYIGSTIAIDASSEASFLAHPSKSVFSHCSGQGGTLATSTYVPVDL